MKTSARLLLIALLAAAIIGSESHGADFRVPAGDGWYTWQVEAADGSDLQLYALMEAGTPVKLRARGNSICFYGFNEEASDLGHVTVDQSINWLHGYIYPVSDLSTDAILLISLHAGELPVDILERLLAVAD
ncbi:MAG: hypothetical protein QNI96_06920 [Woeseiaceae bacterium]|nr:hypothetical protein [Woeseiaceae bacterium]